VPQAFDGDDQPQLTTPRNLNRMAAAAAMPNAEHSLVAATEWIADMMHPVPTKTSSLSSHNNIDRKTPLSLQGR
jgi:hypothetical protein